jgi:membrane-bound ClpP family serine protease
MNAIALNLPVRKSCLIFGFLLGALMSSAASVAADDAERGLFVTVFNPITDASITQIQNTIDRNRSQGVKPLRVVVFDFNPGGAEAATENYGTALTLARYIKELGDNHGIGTVAYLRNKTTRHTVLPVLACKDIVMAQDARIGEIAKPNETIRLEDQQQYARYAGILREAAVMKMLDPNVEIVMGNKGGQRLYLDSAWVGKRPGFEDAVVTNQNNPKPRGNLALWDVSDAATFQLCQVSGLQTREDVANHFRLDPASLRGDPWGDEKIKACKIELTGLINEEMKAKLLNQLKEVRAKKENVVFFVLDCSGGVAKVAREIADELRELKRDDKKPIRTIAFIPNRAPDLATFIAFGCSEIIMYKGGDKESEAQLGDFGQFLATMAQSKEPSNTLQFIRENLREIARKQGYPELVVDAMLDKETTLYQVKPKQGTNLLLMTPEQWKGAGGDKEFNPPRTLKQKGTLLKLDATLAKELRIAQDTVDNRDIKEVYARYGLNEKDVRDSKPGWLDDFAAFLRRTEIWLLLIAIGCAGLILELKMPGATIPGLIALICFVLFFWSQAYANGAMIWLAVGLFVLGLILLAVEIFILPGFGFMGISGIVLILTGLALATMEKAPSSSEEWTTFAAQIFRIGFSLVAACVVAFFFARYLPKIPYVNRLMLSPPTDNQDADGDFAPLPGAEQAAALLGQVGVATSMLRPAGMARIGDIYVDVVTEGDFIEPGTSIQIVEVEGTRIVVKKI